MLDALRRSTGGWIAKIFIALLVMSFAVWGVADIFGGYGGRTVAKVGDTEISQEEFQTALRLRMQNLRRQLGRSMTMEEARAYGLDRAVLSELVDEAALENQGVALNLGISDEAIAEKIMREPMFQDSSGEFSNATFQQLLQANGLSEGAYIARQRNNYIRQQLVETVGTVSELPKTFLRAAEIYRNETRRLKYFTLPVSKLEPVEEPGTQTLQEYYENNKTDYAVPEMRKIGAIPVLPEKVAETMTIDEAELRDYYEARKANFRTPEKRHVRQIPFPDAEAAQEAYERIQAGAGFREIASERGQSEEDTSLGAVSRDEMADAAVAEAAFALEEGEISEPVEGSLSTVIVTVEDIEPASVTSFEAAKDEIRDTLALERAQDEVLDLYNRIEDERAGGGTMPEIADMLNLDYVTLEAVDRQGRGPDGEPVDALPAQDKIVREAFRSDVGVENDPVDTEDQGLVWFEVLEVMPEKTRSLDEVREQVIADWRESEQRKRMTEMARDLVERARKGEKLEDIAAGLALDVEESPLLKREGESEALPRAAIAQAFRLSQGGYGSAAARDGARQVIFQVTEINQPEEPGAGETASLRESHKPRLANDLVAQYVSGLSDTYEVTRNQTLIDQLTGAQSGDQPSGPPGGPPVGQPGGQL